MSAGFVYVVGNRAMPGIFKIGFTERAPSTRIDELSSSTSVPLPFDLICYGEYEEPRVVEYEIHNYFSDRRVDDSREFFYGPLSDIVEQLERCWNPLSFCSHQAIPMIHEEERESHRRWLGSHFFSQCADPIHWPVRAYLEL